MLHGEDIKNIYEQTKYNVEGGLSILKFQEYKHEEQDEGFQVFARILLEAAKNKQITVYSDSLCLHPIDILEVISRLDTVTDCFPVTYRPPNENVIRSFINPEDIKLFRAYQITYYSPKINIWGSKTIAIAPLKMVKDEAGTFISWKPIFWMKVDNKKVNVNASNITWAIRAGAREVEGNVQLKTVKVHKKVLEKPMLHFLDVAKNSKSIRLYSRDSWQQKELLSFEDRQSIFTKIDTILDIDPKTYEQKLKISESKLDFNDINSIRLVQEWAWDNKRKRLSVRLLGVTPIKRMDNEAGEFLFFLPIFYQRFDN
jgi:hypothetical protein